MKASQFYNNNRNEEESFSSSRDVEAFQFQHVFQQAKHLRSSRRFSVYFKQKQTGFDLLKNKEKRDSNYILLAYKVFLFNVNIKMLT